MNKRKSVLIACCWLFVTWGVFGVPAAVAQVATDVDSRSPGSASENLAQANNDFAFDLYRQLVTKDRDNLFFSPYSVSQTLAMVTEGARGQTAKELKRVLHFVEARKQGERVEPVPVRKLNLFHSGYAALNKRLNAAQANPKYDTIRAEVRKCEKEIAALDAKIEKMSMDMPWGFGANESRGGFGIASEEDDKKSEAIYEKIDELDRKRNGIKDRMLQLESSISACEFLSANRIWSDNRFTIKNDFVNFTNKYYAKGGVRSVDFHGNFENAHQEINAWCAEKTKNRIKDVFPRLPEAQARSMAFALTNAIYFRADWQTKFDPGKTKKASFTCLDGAKVETPMMHGSKFAARYSAFNQDGTLFPTPEKIKHKQTEGLYPDQDGFSIVELPYRGNEISMLLIAPNHFRGLKVIEEKLTAANLSHWLEQLQSRQVDIVLPKFKYEANYDFKEALMAMGVNQAFDLSADFNGLINCNDGQPVYLGMVQHKTVIEVNETSTEAAAATFSGGLFGAPPMKPFTPEFRADRPFLYIIRDIATGTVLFVGRMSRP